MSQIDYAAANKKFRAQKGALTRAIKKGPEAVLREVAKAKAEWDEAPFNGAWPDDWARWERAAEDARWDLQDLRRAQAGW